MTPTVTRRHLLLAAAPITGSTPRELLTPHKVNRLVLAPSGKPGAFDEKAVDCPFVFRHGNRFGMTFLGFDGAGYQTGLAWSENLLDWTVEACIAARDPANPLFQHNVAINWIVRENDLFSPGRLRTFHGEYIGVYHAYPNPGYEQGPAVIGICRSRDLRSWRFDAPCLRPEDGAPWERGGLYKPCLLEHNGTFHLFYNAKNQDRPWREQTGVATSRDLRTFTRDPGSPVIGNGPPGAPDERFASDPCVLRFRRQWALFYFGLDAKGVARDVVALSADLRAFTKCDAILIDTGGPGSIDEKYAHKPSVIAHQGALYHFYCAVAKNDRRGISVARSQPFALSSYP